MSNIGINETNFTPAILRHTRLNDLMNFRKLTPPNDSRKRLFAKLVLALPAAILMCVLTPNASLADKESTTPQTTTQQKLLLNDLQSAFSKIADSVEPSVVNIKAQRMRANESADIDDDQQNKPGKSPDPKIPQLPKKLEATGSGVIISEDGYILTNDHVVNGSIDNIVTVTLADGRVYKGKVFSDFRSDLAVVKIDAGISKLPAAKFADSSKVHVGQWAIAVGSPFGLENTMTVGIISAIGRHQNIPGESPDESRYYPELIQTDAAINPGNSGGPLFNIDGQVVGINVAIESPSEGSAGIGFAIPTSIAMDIMNKLIKNGKVVRGYLGVSPDDLTPALKEEYNQPTGAFLREVLQGTPAAKAGLQAADIITYYDNQPIDGEVSLRTAMANTTPNKTVKIVYVRNGIPAATSATLISAPLMASEQRVNTGKPTTEKQNVGLNVRDVTPKDRQSNGYPADTQGVYVVNVEPDGLVDSAGMMARVLLPGAVIQKIGKTPVHNSKEFAAAIESARKQSEFTLVILRSDGSKIRQTAITIRT